MFMQKFQAIFPLDNDADIVHDLLEFTWKYIYIYVDHLSVFKAKT